MESWRLHLTMHREQWRYRSTREAASTRIWLSAQNRHRLGDRDGHDGISSCSDSSSERISKQCHQER